MRKAIKRLRELAERKREELQYTKSFSDALNIEAYADRLEWAARILWNEQKKEEDKEG